MKNVVRVAAAAAFAALVFSIPAEAQEKKGAVTGTVVDTYCLVTMNMGGTAHTQCSVTCAKSGAPLAVKEDKTGIVYLAAGQKNMLYASSGLEKYMEQRVTVRGKVYERDGVKMIVVDSAAPAK